MWASQGAVATEMEQLQVIFRIPTFQALLSLARNAQQVVAPMDQGGSMLHPSSCCAACLTGTPTAKVELRTGAKSKKQEVFHEPSKPGCQQLRLGGVVGNLAAWVSNPHAKKAGQPNPVAPQLLDPAAVSSISWLCWGEVLYTPYSQGCIPWSALSFMILGRDRRSGRQHIATQPLLPRMMFLQDLGFDSSHAALLLAVSGLEHQPATTYNKPKGAGVRLRMLCL